MVDFKEMLAASKSIYNGEENSVIISDAKPSRKNMIKTETGYMSLLWNDLMDRSHTTSVELQRSKCDALKATNLLKSLMLYVLLEFKGI